MTAGPWCRHATAAVAIMLVAACGRTPAPATPAAEASRPAVFHDPPELIARFASGLPIGTTVAVALADGGRLSGILMEVQSSGVVIKRRTRVPEPVRAVPFDRIASIEPERSDGGSLKAAVLGAAAGAAAIFGVLLILLAHS